MPPKVSKFCASRYYFSYIYNYMILFSLYAGSLRIGGESHQGTAQVTTIFVGRWLTQRDPLCPPSTGSIPLSGQPLARSALKAIEPETLIKHENYLGGEQRQIVAGIGKK